MQTKAEIFLIALALGLLTGCGGLSLTDAAAGPHNGFIYSPPVVTPPVEVYQDLGSWKTSCFDTLPPGVYQNASLAAWADQIFNEVNAARAANGVPALIRSHGLDMVEQAHCRDTMLRHYNGHKTPEGWDPEDRLKFAQLKDYSAAPGSIALPGGKSPSAITIGPVSENYARGYESAHEIVQGWLNSPEHRKSLMDPQYKYVGTGVYFYDPDVDMPVNAFQLFVNGTTLP
jgi:uncharacterized protein YkwD